jgi:hypothetical protein
MSAVYPLYTITSSLQTCRTEKVDPTPEGTYYVCMLPYSQKDDSEDPNELPCEAVRLVPCGHNVGSECLKLMIRRQGLSNCSMCTTPLTIITNPIKKPMRWLLSNFYVRSHVDRALLLGTLFANSEDVEVAAITALHAPEHQAKLIELSERFFAQQLTRIDALSLWLHYMKLTVMSTLGLRLYIWLPIWICTLANAWYEEPIETLAISIITGKDYHTLMSKNMLRILAYAIDNVILVGTHIAMEQLPHHHFKFHILQTLAKSREVMTLLNRNTIKMQRMLWVDIEGVIGLGFVLAFLISYGLPEY